jgi:outer membrane protein OmpA-like peptidoglycan-associated protein
MTRHQWMWLWIWLLLFFIIFCVWNKLQSLTVDNKTETQTVESPTQLATEKQISKEISRDINFKIIKEDNSIKFFGVFPSKEALESLKEKYKKISDNIIEGTIIIDENAQNNKIIELMPTLAEDFAKFKNGYLEYADKKLTIEGVVSDENISRSIGQKAVLAGDLLVDNRVTVDESSKKEKVEKKSEYSTKDIQEELNNLLKIKKIEFVFAKDILTEKGKKTIDEVAKILKKHKNIKVEIGGHTDSVGTKKHNKILSQKRADAVKRYLISQKIDTKRLKAVGYGESRPLVKNNSSKNRQINRRVEFKIIGE